MRNEYKALFLIEKWTTLELIKFRHYYWHVVYFGALRKGEHVLMRDLTNGKKTTPAVWYGINKVSLLCRKDSVIRQFCDKWINAYVAGGLNGLN